jgi:hypothetical protein
LLAKALTQAYRFDLPDVIANRPDHQGPSWALHNPGNITLDPVFHQLNSEVPQYQGSRALAPLLTVDHSALNQQVWQWIQSDPATNSWLDGTPDKADPVAVDPDYVGLHLGKAPASDSYPRAYSGVLNLGFCVPPDECSQKKEKILKTADLLPFAADFDAAAATTLAASDTGLTPQWDPTVELSDGTSGWWDQVGAEPLGQIFMGAASDMPDLAAYGLIAAQFCAPSGGNCVGPSIDSVTKALGSATADAQGLLHVNPAKVPVGGYPLVDVVYAAVPIHQDAAALTDYADLIQYAAGLGTTDGGQTPGSAPGDLPPGYLPLPASLKAKAQAVVNQLRAIVNPHATQSPPPNPSHSTTSTQSGSGSTSGSNSSGGSTSGSGTTPNPAAGAAAASARGATPSGSPSASGPVYLAPAGQESGGTTPRSDMGSIRWVLVAVVLIGAAGLLGGGLLRSGRLPRWPSRRQT